MGRTKNGKKDGPWIRWYKNKKVPEVVLIDIPEPQSKETWSGGKKEIGAWKDDKKHGLWTTYYANQQIKDIGTYDNGLYHGKWIFYYENGKKEKEGTLKHGNAHDNWVFYNDKGEKTQQGTFNEGVKALHADLNGVEPSLLPHVGVEQLFNFLEPFYIAAAGYVLAFLAVIVSWVRWPKFLNQAAFALI